MDHLSCVGMSLRSRTYIYENQINLLVQLEAVSSSFDVQHVPGSRHLLELNTSSIMNTITRSTQEAEEDDKDIDWKVRCDEIFVNSPRGKYCREQIAAQKKQENNWIPSWFHL